MTRLIPARFAFASALLVASSTAAHAAPVATSQAQPSPTPSASPLSEIGRVVTSDRRDEPIARTSRPTFVVDRERIEALGARTVADALQGVPGVETFAYGPFGAQVDYGIRGALPAQTLVLVDGLPVTDPSTGTVYLAQFSTAGVERIEIVESGSSTLYGSNAAGGVINIITRAPRGTYLEASAGSFADRDARVGIGDGSIGVTYERHVATNAFAYPALTYSQSPCAGSFSGGPCAFPAGVRDDAYADQTSVRVDVDRALGDGFRVRGRADTSQTAIGVPGRLDFLAPTASEANALHTAQLDLSRSMRSSTLTLSLAGAQTRLAYVDPVNNFGESDVYAGHVQVSLRDSLSGKRADAVVGIDLARDSAALSFPTTPNFVQPNGPPTPAYGLGASRASSAAYVQVGTAPFAGARIVAGLRAENDPPSGGVLAPTFGGLVRSGRFAFSGNVGESYRVPTIEDLYYPGASNPNLAPERSSNADATLAFDAPSGSFSIGYFGRSGSNFIVFDPVRFIPVNARRAQTAGFALTATSRPFLGVIAEANVTDLYRALDLTTGARLPRNPVGQASVALSRSFGPGRYAFGVRWGIVGSDGDDAANRTGPAVATYDAYDSLDAYVRFKLAPEAVLSLRGFNLGDTRAAPIFGYPAPGRRFFVELSTR
jgi:vitamin B12 transporter